MKKWVVIFIGCLFLASCGKTESILFYSFKCPHCERVLVFINNHSSLLKKKMELKEVSQNRNNLFTLVEIMQRCNLPVTNQVEIPLLWTGKSCVIGEQDIIGFLRK
jgi:hypothetical protein